MRIPPLENFEESLDRFDRTDRALVAHAEGLMSDVRRVVAQGRAIVAAVRKSEDMLRAVSLHEGERHRLLGAVALLRKAFHNDGAEGESVHLVCDFVEAILKGDTP